MTKCSFPRLLGTPQWPGYPDCNTVFPIDVISPKGGPATRLDIIIAIVEAVTTFCQVNISSSMTGIFLDAHTHAWGFCLLESVQAHGSGPALSVENRERQGWDYGPGFMDCRHAQQVWRHVASGPELHTLAPLNRPLSVDSIPAFLRILHLGLLVVREALHFAFIIVSSVRTYTLATAYHALFISHSNCIPSTFLVD